MHESILLKTPQHLLVKQQVSHSDSKIWFASALIYWLRGVLVVLKRECSTPARKVMGLCGSFSLDLWWFVILQKQSFHTFYLPRHLPLHSYLYFMLSGYLGPLSLSLLSLQSFSSLLKDVFCSTVPLYIFLSVFYFVPPSSLWPCIFSLADATPSPPAPREESLPISGSDGIKEIWGDWHSFSTPTGVRCGSNSRLRQGPAVTTYFYFVTFIYRLIAKKTLNGLVLFRWGTDSWSGNSRNAVSSVSHQRWQHFPLPLLVHDGILPILGGLTPEGLLFLQLKISPVLAGCSHIASGKWDSLCDLRCLGVSYYGMESPPLLYLGGVYCPCRSSYSCGDRILDRCLLES